MVASILFLALAYILGMLHYTSRRGLMREVMDWFVMLLYMGIVAGAILIFVAIAPIVAHIRYTRTIKKINQTAREYREDLKNKRG